MTHTLFSLALIIAVALCPNYAYAQQPDKSQTKDAALREKAFKLLESVAGQLTNLQSPENRARLAANIADSLWNHDEKRARALFVLVQDDINNGLANRDLEDPNDLHTIKVFVKLRVDTVERIAKYDAELALAFLKSTEFVSDKPLPPDLRESEQGLEMRLAHQMASSSPEHAVKLARESLTQRGLSNNLIVLLRQVSKKDKEQALILYKAILKKLGDLDFTKNYAARRFAENLAQTFQPSDNSAFRTLIGMFVTRALDHGCGRPLNADDPKANFCYWAASILPQLETIDPRAAQLKRWVRDEMNLTIPVEAIHQWYEAVEDGSIDDLLAFAAKYPEVREKVYWEAIRRAGRAGDFEQARKILSHVADSDRKEAVLAEIDRRQKSMPTDEKRLAEVQKGLQYSSTTLERVRYLLNYADFFGGYDRNAASKLIKQASEMADTMKPGKDQTEAQMLLAMTYCSDKNDRGFAIMESLMPKLNELVEAAVKLDGYETRYVRDGEWNMSAGGSVGDLLTRLSQTAGSFAWCDFDRAVSLAAQFDRTEIRLMAHVKLAQAILAGPRHRRPIDFDYIYY